MEHKVHLIQLFFIFTSFGFCFRPKGDGETESLTSQSTYESDEEDSDEVISHIPWSGGD